jgi:hypothetical protein
VRLAALISLAILGLAALLIVFVNDQPPDNMTEDPQYLRRMDSPSCSLRAGRRRRGSVGQTILASLCARASDPSRIYPGVNYRNVPIELIYRQSSLEAGDTWL